MLFGLRYFLPHICLVYEHDIKDTDCWAQNGSTPSITVICNKQDKKSNENLLYIFYSAFIDRASDPSSIQFPFFEKKMRRQKRFFYSMEV